MIPGHHVLTLKWLRSISLVIVSKLSVPDQDSFYKWFRKETDQRKRTQKEEDKPVRLMDPPSMMQLFFHQSHTTELLILHRSSHQDQYHSYIQLLDFTVTVPHRGRLQKPRIPLLKMASVVWFVVRKGKETPYTAAPIAKEHSRALGQFLVI